MTRRPRRNDRRPDRPTGGAVWLWGWHAVQAALANPARGAPQRLLAVPDRARRLNEMFPALRPEVVEARVIEQTLGRSGVVHQGTAALVSELQPASLADLAQPASGLLVMLDQATDPQNVGAIFRSAAAFGARGVILQDRHAPPLTGAMAKAAAGALERIGCAREVNLTRTLEKLSDWGWRCVGLDAKAPATLDEILDPRPTVLVLGSEDEGLRRLVSEHCDVLARIPMPGGFESLNVATAAAISLYAAQGAQGRAKGRQPSDQAGSSTALRP